MCTPPLRGMYILSCVIRVLYKPTPVVISGVVGEITDLISSSRIISVMSKQPSESSVILYLESRSRVPF